MPAGVRVAAPNVTIDGLQFTCAAGCIAADAGAANLVVKNNDASVATGAAIDLSSTWTGGGVSVHHNTLHGFVDSVIAVDNAAANLAGVAVSRNSIVGPGVRNDLDPGALDATCNWWGSAAGASAGRHIGNVTVSPSLHTADLDGACVDPVVVPPLPRLRRHRRHLLTRLGSPTSFQSLPHVSSILDRTRRRRSGTSTKARSVERTSSR